MTLRKEVQSYLAQVWGLQASAGPTGRWASNASRTQSSAEWTGLNESTWITSTFISLTPCRSSCEASPSNGSRSCPASDSAGSPGRCHWSEAAGSPAPNKSRVLKPPRWREEKSENRSGGATYLQEISQLLLHTGHSSLLESLWGGNGGATLASYSGLCCWCY